MRIFWQMAIVTAISLVSATGSMAADPSGKELIKANGCLGCHKLNDSGGSLGPALDQVGARMSETELQRKLLDPKATFPKSMMPSYQRLPEKDLKAMVDYLKSLQ